MEVRTKDSPWNVILEMRWTLDADVQAQSSPFAHRQAPAKQSKSRIRGELSVRKDQNSGYGYVKYWLEAY